MSSEKDSHTGLETAASIMPFIRLSHIDIRSVDVVLGVIIDYFLPAVPDPVFLQVLVCEIHEFRDAQGHLFTHQRIVLVLDQHQLFLLNFLNFSTFSSYSTIPIIPIVPIVPIIPTIPIISTFLAFPTFPTFPIFPTILTFPPF